MSLILEALRKSEAERRRGQAPDVATELAPVALARRAATPPWIVPAAVVVVLALLAAAWWARRDRDDAVGPTLPAPVADSGDLVVPAQDVAVEAPPVVAARPSPAPVAATPASPVPAPSQVVVLDGPAPRDMPPPPTVPPPPPLPAPDVATGAIPAVKLSMHMWNESPSGRFVILNGQRMVEGDRSGDLTVVAIERDGVVVERNGQRARVPLP